MMKRSAVIIVDTALLLLFTLAAGAAFLQKNRTDRKEELRSGAVFLPPFSPEKVTGIKIQAGEDVLKIVSREGRWIMPDCENANASRAAVTELLMNLAKTTPLREIPVSGEDMLKQLNLSTEAGLKPGFGAGIYLTLFEGEKEILSVLMGRAHVRKSEDIPGVPVSVTYDGRYLRTDLDGSPHVFLVSRVFEKCIPSSASWLEPLKIDSIASGVRRIQVMKTVGTGKTKEPCWIVIPDPVSRSFTLAYPADSVLALPELVKRLELLTGPFSRGLVPAEKAKELHFTESMTIVCGNGVVSTLDFARHKDGMAAVRLTQVFYPKQFPRMTGESDLDYQRRKQDLEYRVSEMEKTFSGRTFLVDPNLPETILRIPEKQEVVKGKK